MRSGAAAVLLGVVAALGLLVLGAAPAAGPGAPSTGTLQIDRPGAWEVVLVASPDVARIPLSVPAPPPTPGWVWAVRVGAVVAAVGAVGAAAVWRRRPRTARGLGAVALVGVTTAVTAGLLSPNVAPPAPTPMGHERHGSGGGAVVLTPDLQPSG